MSTNDQDHPFRDRLVALSGLIDRLQSHAFRDDGLVEELASASRELFRAEDVSVFLVPDENPRELRLVAEHPGPPRPPAAPILIPDDPDRPECGLTAWCATRPEPTRLLGEGSLRQHPAVAGCDHTFTRSPCHSLLAVPLRLKTHRPVGLLKINNRLGPDGPGDAVGFSEEDEFFARILATKVAAQLEGRRVTRAHRRLTESGARCPDPKVYYEEVLRTGIQLLRCDRAMLALADANHKPVMVAMANSEDTARIGQELPPRGVMRRCWGRRDDQRVPDVSDADYVESDHRTRSEAAVLLTWEGVRFGVLNVESDRLDHFDDHDLETLRSLVPFIAASYRAVAKDEHFRRILREIGTYQWTHESVLQVLLDAAVDTFGFANGHIFVPTGDIKKIAIRARRGPKLDGLPPDFEFPLTGPVQSVQRKVFESREAYFCDSPEADAAFNREGLQRLRITGPYLATPLLTDDCRPVGVLSVWGEGTNGDSRAPSQADIPLVAHYARVAAAVIDLSSRRRAFRDTLLAAIPTLQKPADPNDLWPKLLNIVERSGFPRVRLFRYREESREFELLAVTPPGTLILNTKFSARKGDNPYSHDTVERAAKSAHPFEHLGNEFGPDPLAAVLDKAPNAPWIVIPLISHGRLFGQITADRGGGADQQRRTDPETLENLALVGAVAALAVAQTETATRLRWRSLDKLHAAIAYGDTERGVVRKLLVYLTHRDALGFSRAGFYAYKPKARRFEFLTGLGSVDEDRFRAIGQLTDELMIDQTLADAERHDDPQIEAAFRPVTIGRDDPGVAGLIAGPAAREYSLDKCAEWPEWVRRIAAAIHGSTPLVVTPVLGIGGTCYGLFVVDRQWQDRPVSETDVSVLTSFGPHAALLLSQREAAEQRLRAQRGAVWKDVSLATAHQVSGPISTIANEYDTLRMLLEAAGRDVKDVLDNLGVALVQAQIVVLQFQVLRDVYRRRTAVSVDRPMADVIEVVLARAGNKRVVISPIVPAGAAYCGPPDGLEECLVELASNAVYWSQQGSRRPPRVVIEVTPNATPSRMNLAPDRNYLLVTVSNNGPPVPPEKLDQFGTSVVKSDRVGGSGFGLFFVWEIVHALGGHVVAVNKPDEVVFELYLPQTP